MKTAQLMQVRASEKALRQRIARTKRAVAKYGRDACLRAVQLNDEGWGPSSIVLNYALQGINSVAACDAAIDAGREIKRVEALLGVPYPY